MDSLQEALNERGAYRMEHFVEERGKTQEKRVKLHGVAA